MKTFPGFIVCLVLLHSLMTASGKPVPIFDGKTFNGWEGDTNKIWRVENGAIMAGKLDRKVARNEFICTTKSYTNFILRLKVKLLGKEGFVNGGVQIRSQRTKTPPNEMAGYQADIGAGWWGAVYDESRRNKIMAKPDASVIERALKNEEWNDYEVRCEGKRIRIFLNGQQTVDYTEADDSIPQFGLIGLQVHGGGMTEIAYKEIVIEELP